MLYPSTPNRRTSWCTSRSGRSPTARMPRLCGSGCWVMATTPSSSKLRGLGASREQAGARGNQRNPVEVCEEQVQHLQAERGEQKNVRDAEHELRHDQSGDPAARDGAQMSDQP